MEVVLTRCESLQVEDGNPKTYAETVVQSFPKIGWPVLTAEEKRSINLFHGAGLSSKADGIISAIFQKWAAHNNKFFFKLRGGELYVYCKRYSHFDCELSRCRFCDSECRYMGKRYEFCKLKYFTGDVPSEVITLLHKIPSETQNKSIIVWEKEDPVLMVEIPRILEKKSCYYCEVLRW